MWRSTTLHAAIVLGAVAVAGALTVLQAQSLPEMLFYSVILTVLAYVGRLGVRATRLARSEHGRVAHLLNTAPGAVATAAVQEERRRLAEDIASCLRESLVKVRDEATTASDHDPSLALQRIHAESQRATSELRRHLGLLRHPVEPAQPVPTEREQLPRRAPRPDLLLAVAMMTLAALESLAYSATDGSADWSWWSVALTALAGGTVVGRTVALSEAAAVCGVLYALGAVAGTPVVNGFWTLGSVAILVWTIATRQRPTRTELAAGGFLVVAIAVSGWVADRDNVGLMAFVLTVAVTVGLAVRHERGRSAAAHEIASAREMELRSAARSAVRAERTAFAREIHDVVSHAVGVVAVQAGAAQVSWPREPETAQRALSVIRATAESALAELDRLQPQTPAQPTIDDIQALVDRIRAAGTAVDFEVVGELPADAAIVVYRVVQESLTNVVRHAPSADVHVTIRSDPRRIAVRVVDDGPGRAAAARQGYGLTGLAERVAFAGGYLELGTGPTGTGFRVEAFLPVRSDAVTQ